MTYRGEFFVEAIDKATQNVTSVNNLFGILTNDPDQCSPSVGLVQLINTLTQGWNNAFVAGIFTENIFNNHDSLLHDVVHLRVNQV